MKLIGNKVAVYLYVGWGIPTYVYQQAHSQSGALQP